MASIFILLVIFCLPVYGLADPHYPMCIRRWVGAVVCEDVPRHSDRTACYIEKNMQTGFVDYACGTLNLKKRKRNECVKDVERKRYYYYCEYDSCNSLDACSGWFKDNNTIDDRLPIPPPPVPPPVRLPGASPPAPAPGASDAAPSAPAPPPSPKSTGTRCDGPTLAILVLLFGVYFTV